MVIIFYSVCKDTKKISVDRTININNETNEGNREKEERKG